MIRLRSTAACALVLAIALLARGCAKSYGDQLSNYYSALSQRHYDVAFASLCSKTRAELGNAAGLRSAAESKRSAARLTGSFEPLGGEPTQGWTAFAVAAGGEIDLVIPVKFADGQTKLCPTPAEPFGRRAPGED